MACLEIGSKPETGETETAGFESDFQKIQNLDKAITRISNFSVARVCKDPPGVGGAEGPPLGDHLHSLSNTREIRNSSDRLVWIVWICCKLA